jgi:hypothetical protein
MRHRQRGGTSAPQYWFTRATQNSTRPKRTVFVLLYCIGKISIDNGLSYGYVKFRQRDGYVLKLTSVLFQFGLENDAAPTISAIIIQARSIG